MAGKELIDKAIGAYMRFLEAEDIDSAEHLLELARKKARDYFGEDISFEYDVEDNYAYYDLDDYRRLVFIEDGSYFVLWNRCPNCGYWLERDGKITNLIELGRMLLIEEANVCSFCGELVKERGKGMDDRFKDLVASFISGLLDSSHLGDVYNEIVKFFSGLGIDVEKYVKKYDYLDLPELLGVILSEEFK